MLKKAEEGECNRCGEEIHQFEFIPGIWLPVCIRPGCSHAGLVQAPAKKYKGSNIYKNIREAYYDDAMNII